jgi:hypothetical protein
MRMPNSRARAHIKAINGKNQRKRKAKQTRTCGRFETEENTPTSWTSALPLGDQWRL